MHKHEVFIMGLLQTFARAKIGAASISKCLKNDCTRIGASVKCTPNFTICVRNVHFFSFPLQSDTTV